MIRVVDMFAGVGGFHVALRSLGCEIVGYSEINAAAKEVYGRNFGFVRSLGDITKLHVLPEHDVFTGGVPCQSWSKAGLNLGFDDSRGRLWNDTTRLIRQSQPKAFILENVRGLTEPRHASAFEHILSELKACGYNVSWRLLNSSDFSVPQNRERVYFVGIRNDFDVTYDWPLPTGKKQLNEVLPDIEPGESSVDWLAVVDVRGGINSIHSWDINPVSPLQRHVCETLLSVRRSSKYGPKDGNAVPIEELVALTDCEPAMIDSLVSLGILRKYDERVDFVNSKISSGVEGVYRVYMPSATAFGTLTATGSQDFLCSINLNGDVRTQFIENVWPDRNRTLRRLTPLDAALLQGFPEDFQLHHNTSTSMRLMGNSVTVPVVREIARSLFALEIFDGT